jgi:putative DNA primase/helicase
MTDPVTLFRDELVATFGQFNDRPIPDGQIHRFHVPGDRAGSRNGWYVLYLDGIASGAFGSWKAGSSRPWSSREPADARELEQLRQRIEQARQQREAEQHQRQQVAAVTAQRLWAASASAAADHPYLIRKGVKAHALRQRGSVLLVPLYLGGVLVNLQRIYRDGAKRFLAGGRVAGGYSPIGTLEPGCLLYVCEGWATGATLHEHTGAAVACAMNAGNLLEAGRQLRRLYPDAQLVFAGDDDRQTAAEGKGNPGRTAANAAAIAVGGQVVFPVWPADAPLSLSDFNDLAAWRASHEPA